MSPLCLQASTAAQVAEVNSSMKYKALKIRQNAKEGRIGEAQYREEKAKLLSAFEDSQRTLTREALTAKAAAVAALEEALESRKTGVYVQAGRETKSERNKNEREAFPRLEWMLCAERPP